MRCRSKEGDVIEEEKMPEQYVSRHINVLWFGNLKQFVVTKSDYVKDSVTKVRNFLDLS